MYFLKRCFAWNCGNLKNQYASNIIEVHIFNLLFVFNTEKYFKKIHLSNKKKLKIICQFMVVFLQNLFFISYKFTSNGCIPAFCKWHRRRAYQNCHHILSPTGRYDISLLYLCRNLNCQPISQMKEILAIIKGALEYKLKKNFSDHKMNETWYFDLTISCVHL